MIKIALAAFLTLAPTLVAAAPSGFCAAIVGDNTALVSTITSVTTTNDLKATWKTNVETSGYPVGPNMQGCVVSVSEGIAETMQRNTVSDISNLGYKIVLLSAD